MISIKSNWHKEYQVWTSGGQFMSIKQSDVPTINVAATADMTIEKAEELIKALQLSIQVATGELILNDVGARVPA